MWGDGLVVVLALWATVHFLGNAWELVTAPAEACSTVVDRDRGRGTDFACSPDGDTSRGWALAFSAGVGLVFGAIAVMAAAMLVMRRRSSSA